MFDMCWFAFGNIWAARVLGRASSWPQRKSKPWRHDVVASRDAFEAVAALSSEVLGSQWVSLPVFSRRSRQGLVATARLLLDDALAPALRCPQGHGWEAIRVLETHISRNQKPFVWSLQHSDEKLTTDTLSATYGLRFVTITRLVQMVFFHGQTAARRWPTDGGLSDPCCCAVLLPLPQPA